MKPRVLVGVDASPGSVEALRRAVDEARWRDATLEVVYAFAPPERSAAFPAMPADDSEAELERAQQRAAEWLDQWLESLEIDFAGVELDKRVVANRKSATAIIDRSGDADLIVVGSRGRGGFAGLRLGSTSEQVTRHAQCPVLVVREREKDRKAGRSRA